jgi:hypothetical protein
MKEIQWIETKQEYEVDTDNKRTLIKVHQEPKKEKSSNISWDLLLKLVGLTAIVISALQYCNSSQRDKKNSLLNIYDNATSEMNTVINWRSRNEEFARAKDRLNSTLYIRLHDIDDDSVKKQYEACFKTHSTIEYVCQTGFDLNSLSYLIIDILDSIGKKPYSAAYSLPALKNDKRYIQEIRDSLLNAQAKLSSQIRNLKKIDTLTLDHSELIEWKSVVANADSAALRTEKLVMAVSFLNYDLAIVDILGNDKFLKETHSKFMSEAKIYHENYSKLRIEITNTFELPASFKRKLIDIKDKFINASNEYYKGL